MIGNPGNFDDPELKKRKMIRIIIIIIISAILLITIIALIFYFLLRPKDDKDICEIGENEKCLKCKKNSMECGKCNPYFRLENGKCVFIYSFEAIYDIYHLTNDINETTKLFNVENLADYEINKIQVDDVYFENNTNYFKFDSVGEHKVRINIELNNSTSLKKFFENIKELISINFKNDFNTTGIENMTEMFSSSQNLISVDISNLNCENVKDMSYMFKNCEKLKDIDISNLNQIK